MEKNEKKPLMNLPESTKVLINQGVYSLYSLKEPTANAAKFALFADNEIVYLLAEDGSVIAKEPSSASIHIVAPISFPDLKMPMSLKVNGLAC